MSGFAARLPRDLHPAAWWSWAIGLATFASFTTNPYLLLALIGTASLVVVARRSDQPWGRMFRLYLALGAMIVVLRVFFRILLGGTSGTVVLDLPTIPLPDWVLGIRLLGPVTQEALLAGLYDGLRLAAIVICVGAANALANPKRLLRSVPPALYEVGTALIVAITVLPQLAESVNRVRTAQALRAATVPRGFGHRTRRLRRLIVPVLEDALDRSLALAAGMDTRGYGRSGDTAVGARRTSSALMLLGLVGLAVGAYAVLDGEAPRVLAGPMVALGLAAAVAGLTLAGRRTARTVYRPDRWRWPEVVVALNGLAVAVIGWWLARTEPLVAYPDIPGAPPVTLLALVGAVGGVIAAVAAPVPVSVTAQGTELAA